MVWFQDRSLAIYRLFVVGRFITRWIKTISTQIQKRWLFSGIRYITLWIIASKFASNFLLYIDDLIPIGPGVQRGTLAHFPIYQIDLATLPITPATLPLLMVYKGDLAREREIVQSLVEHYHELGEMRNFISILHPQAIKEVLQEMNIESLRGFDLDLPAILELFPPEQVIQAIGWEKIIQNLDASALNEQERELLIEQLRQLNEDDN